MLAVCPASQVAQWVKNPPAMQEMQADVCLIPGPGRCYGGGLGNPLQYSCLENPMDRGAWWTTVHGGAKSQTRQVTEQACTHAHAMCQTVFQAL